MSLVQTIGSQEDLPRHLGASIYALINATWPPKPGARTATLDETLAKWKHWESAHFLITADSQNSNEVLAHALIFRRDIITSHGPLGVGALAKVCVHSEYRGRGWGADVVRAAFAYLPTLGVSVSLFQTGVPPFYEKLGGRLVTNRFVSGDSPVNPFWDTYEMIYPKVFDWPDGRIDLNGPGY